MHDIWKDMFVIGVPLAEKILRPIIVYAFLVVSLRLSGSANSCNSIRLT